MKALINPLNENVVCDIAPQSFDVAPPLYWVDCDDAIFPYQHKYVDGSFIDYTPEPMPQLPKPSKEELIAQIEALTAKIQALE